MIRLEAKLPVEVRNYEHDWSAFLGTDTIASQTTSSADVTISGADIVDSGAVANKATVFTVGGGALGNVAVISQTITTAGGLTETETFALPIRDDEPVSLGDVKAALRVLTYSEDAKIAAMIPRARLWVEDYTGVALIRRQFAERRRVEHRGIRLFKGPLISVDSVTYSDGQTYAPQSFPPDTRLLAASGGIWPVLLADDAFEITYTAGFAPEQIDDRLIGAMLALIEGEFSAGQAYPQDAVDAAERCCSFLRRQF